MNYLKKILVVSIMSSITIVAARPVQLNCVGTIKSVDLPLYSVCSNQPSHQFIVSLDTNNLNNTVGTLEIKPCWTDTIRKIVNITSSPDTISLIPVNDKKYGFNITRKTLKAGWDDDREFTCTISDIDTSKNKI